MSVEYGWMWGIAGRSTLTFSWIIFNTAVESGVADDMIRRLIESRIIGCTLEFNVL